MARGEDDAAGVRARVPNGREQFSWAMFDWANQPYYAMVAGVIFVPYFIQTVAPDPVTGQAWLGLTAGLAGLFVAITSPILGAIADVGGARKPWMLVFSAFFVAALTALWWALPGAPGGLLPIAIALFLAGVSIELTAVFNNAMLADIAPPGRVGWLSGLGFGLGYIGGLVALLIILFGFSLPAAGVIQGAPLFGLDVASHEHDRLIGPFSALWFTVFVVPMFLYVGDRPARKVRALEAARRGLATLAQTLRRLPEHANTVKFLLARMIYNDGLSLVWVFGAAYGTGLFSWTTAESGLFGLVIIVFAAMGAFAGGWLDDRMGAKRTLFVANALLIAGALLAVVVESDRIFFVVPAGAPLWQGPIGTWPEIVYLISGILIGLGGGPQQAASRSLMTRLSPPHLATEFFGLYSLSGRATNFIGPFLVAWLTTVWADQRAAIFVILVHLVIGVALLTLVRDPHFSGESAARR